MRIAVIGNAAGGKSTLSRRLAKTHDLPRFEVDAWQWGPGWQPRPEAEYEPKHAAAIAQDRWIIDGVGAGHMVRARMARATDIVFVDLPMWQHYWLAAERQRRWHDLPPEERPAGDAEPASTKDLFRLMDEIARDYVPKLKQWAKECEGPETRLHILHDIEDVAAFSLNTAE